MSRHRGRDGCKVTGVSRDVCYLRFGLRTAVVLDHSASEYITARGERLILDLDADSKVVGIELVADWKPCHRKDEANS